MAEIRKKILPEYFGDLLEEGKHHEIRIADFNASVGDTIVLREWDPDTENYTGREIKRKISYVSNLKVDDGFYDPEEIKTHGFYVFSLEEDNHDK